jgi:succinate-semialdehyde dehydrogenase / glutarate-semialdehyde dehydrogenase
MSAVAKTTLPRLRADFLIGGRWVEAVSGERREILDPATGEVVGDTAYGDSRDADRALAAATQAFVGWSRTPVAERARILERGAALLRERLEPIAVALTREQGKPLPDSRKELRFAADVFSYYAELAKHRADEWRPTSRPEMRSLVIRQPLGVVVAIVPWNFPVDLFSWKAAPALAAGCTVVVKPAPETPLATAAAIQCFMDAGLPEGVLNYVVGPVETLGETLVTDPRSRMIAFTGSTASGRRIMALASTHVKRLNLELGGHTPMIILEDADLDATIPAAVRRSFSNMGQICNAVNRLYVARTLADEFQKRFVEATTRLKLGPGLEPGVEYGPMINEKQVARTEAHVEDAVGRGARLLWGGGRPDGDRFEKGHFYEPTVLADVPDEAKTMREETFGPVAPIASFASLDEVIRRANSTEYGLVAYVFGKDLGRALLIAEQLEFGGVGINVNDVTELASPFGGWKESGIGREMGPEGLEAYLEPKHIRMRLGAMIDPGAT